MPSKWKIMLNKYTSSRNGNRQEGFNLLGLWKPIGEALGVEGERRALATLPIGNSSSLSLLCATCRAFGAVRELRLLGQSPVDSGSHGFGSRHPGSRVPGPGSYPFLICSFTFPSFSFPSSPPFLAFPFLPLLSFVFPFPFLSCPFFFLSFLLGSRVVFRPPQPLNLFITRRVVS